LNGDYQHNIVMDMPELQALAASTIGAWRIIRESVAIAPGPEVATVGPTILPVWLQRVCRRKLKLPDNDTYVHAVVEDMADMMSAHGNADVVRAGGALIDDGSYYDEKRAAQLVRLAYTFIEDGRLRFVHESEAHKWQVPLLVLTGGGEQAPAVFLGQETWNTVLAYRKLVLPDPGKMTDTLQIANALDGETTYNGEKGWLINEAWWSRQVEYCRASRHLKVVGGGR
jgi:hypothetical protein